MTKNTPLVEQLRSLSRPERRSRVEELARTEFRTALLMSEGEDVPLDQNYFDLGLTSLRVTEIKQRLEAQLGCAIDTAVLFAVPTLGRLVEYLQNEILPKLIGESTASEGRAASSVPADRRALVTDLLNDLYKG
ncbi:acyl carrier protein [Streptomyces sp. NBC_01235]|uniref:acyl carrier protein n=1 Tax=Streptomyces sp. NBC_01235 TaxID=2903788 RepID=UPI002E160EAA|nr:acyl carrier protein [Streptomyces sp. NBC_01235]